MAGKRGWGGPSIREGSHPPPYMDVAHDLKQCQDILDVVQGIIDDPILAKHPYAQIEKIGIILMRRPDKNA